MTWKKKESTNKGSKRHIHHIPSLPFGEEIDEVTKDQNETEGITSSFVNDVDDTSSVSDSAGDAKLAQVLEEQGTKLAWITLGRAQLNFKELDSVVMSFDRALASKPDSIEAGDDKHTAMLLLKKRRQLQSTRGLSSHQNRYVVQD